MSVPLNDDGLNPFAILGVSRGADSEGTLAAYRVQARRHHPDIARDPEAQQRMSEINAAWAILRNSVRRAAWDEANGLAALEPRDARQPAAGASSRRRAFW